MEYLIGSLDDDGLLRKSSGDIADELAIYNNVYVVYVLDLRQQQRKNALFLKIFPENSCVVQKKCVPLHSLLRTTVLLIEADDPL